MKPDEVVPEEIPEVEFKQRLELLPHDWTTANVRPETVYAALLQQAPGDAYTESFEDSEVLDAAVNYAIECLTPEDIYILNAIQHEGITFEQLAQRLGVARSQGWRLHRRSLARLRTLLLNHPPIRERLGMEPSWNAAAMAELIAIAGYEEGWDERSTFSLAEVVEWIDECIHTAVGETENGKELGAMRELTWAATHAVWYLRSVGKWKLVDMHTLLCSKQADYGHGNILKFGMVGVMVRASDKAERLKNLTKTDVVTGLGGVAPRNESLLDTFYDVIGYAVIARMLKAETFELQLDPAERESA